MLGIKDSLILAIIGPAFAVAVATQALAQPAPSTISYGGACDGSAAVPLGPSHVAIADDDHNVLRVYQIGQPKPASSLPIDAFLDAPKNKKDEFKEADLEGAARIDDRIYWIGSHGRDSKGDAEPARARFFATRIVAGQNGPQLETVGSAYKNLRDDLLADAKLAGLKLAAAYAPDKKKGGPPPESANGFNIEGLAATADGRLLIGFRNPRPDNKAIVVPIDNPADVVDKGSKPVFGKPVLLNLEGRGIRSLDRIGDRYIITAGPHGTAAESKIKPPFALFSWTGKEGDDPVIIKGVTLPADFSPEALFASADGSTLTLVSDDGDLKGCKKADEAQRTFRTLTIPAPK